MVLFQPPSVLPRVLGISALMDILILECLNIPCGFQRLSLLFSHYYY